MGQEAATETGADAAAIPPSASAPLREHLARLYPGHDQAALLRRVGELVAAYRARPHAPRRAPAGGALFDETDVVLITYGDQIREPGKRPMRALHDFLAERFADVLTGVHVLPFFPSTSDDGFAVSDYEAVDPEIGQWEDVRTLAADFRLMTDAVFNHTSASNPWFRGWLAGDERYRDFYVTAEPECDVSGVTRPRAHPLLTQFETAEGPKSVWTTFSADQVDLNYANPEVLFAVTGVLLDYIADGAGIVRLDAVAFLWKELGTSCVHHRNTHEIVRFWRTLVDAVAPGTLLVTETNVPHTENVSYFGHGSDEAHLVYQFPLAPLVLSAFHLADATTLTEWAAGLSTPSDATAFLNFLGSHDGVGVRPVEGILTHAEIQQLVELAIAHGGGVSYRKNADGSLSPYELNSVFFDALTEVNSLEPPSVQADRFLSAQSILLALAGVPAVYVQALLGSRNWVEGVQESGMLRSINRRKYDRAQLERELDDPSSLRHLVSTRMARRIRARTREAAFHPNGAQRILRVSAQVFALEREAPDGSSAVLCLHSLTGRPQRLRLGSGEGLTLRGRLHDLCSGQRLEVGADGFLVVELPAYGVRWLRTI